MKSLLLENCSIHFENDAYSAINQKLTTKKYTSIFVLTDTHVHTHCLTIFLQKLATHAPLEVIEVEAGEETKNITVCHEIWKTLSELGADRKSLLINLGGGVVTDLGGFIASTYRRGIDFVHFPTSLLAMVDAALGGKNGIDLGNLKNQIGCIVQPQMVGIDPDFLTSLPAEEYRSGLAEMIKHGIIYDSNYLAHFENLAGYDAAFLNQLIYQSVKIKLAIVEADPYENGLRKTLNFGHTLGHAIESYCLSHPAKKRLLHGEAIAIGMILEAHLSHQLLSLNETDLQRISSLISSLFPKTSFSKNDIQAIIKLLIFDKKNEGKQINFVLLNKIGECQIDVSVPNSAIEKAFTYYQKSYVHCAPKK